MKKTLTLLIIITSFLMSNATHIVGGFMSYTYVSGTTYNINLTIYRNCNSATYFDQPAYIGVYNASTNGYVEEILASNLTTKYLQENDSNSCLVASSNVCRQQGVYTFQVTLPSDTVGYIIAYQRCCRNDSITNIFTPSNTGETTFAFIPPTSNFHNNSPVFKNYPPIYICLNQALSFDHSATDPDGDSLSYGLCTPFGGASASNPEPVPAGAPPYSNITWLSPYDLANLLGGNPLAIDPVTGLLTGTPNNVGLYVVGVCVSEYRHGVLINTYLRDFQFVVADCSLPVAKIPSTNVNPSTGIGTFTIDCKDRTINFGNTSYYPVGNAALNYQWNFGVPGASGDTSTAQFPTYTYPDTGTYEVQLIAIKGNSTSQCRDTTYAFVQVYPYFTANFNAQDTCVGGPVLLTDNTTTTFGSINKWSWSFGDNGISSQQNPQHTYASAGNYKVTEIVGSSIGCTDTAVKTVVSYYANDNVISSNPACAGTPVSFNSKPENSYHWNFGGSASSNQQNPSYTYPSAGKYVVSLISQASNGCFDSATTTVNVYPLPAVKVSNDTTICPSGSVSLFASGGKTYTWTPTIGLTSPDSANTIATPSSGVTTIYKVQVTDSNHCSATGSVTISFFSLASIHVGPDTLLCLNQLVGSDTIQLYASGGKQYKWNPVSGLSSTTISNPFAIITTTGTHNYPVAVTDQNSCTQLDTARVSIFPVPVVSATADKSAFCPGDSANVCATAGFALYKWNTNGSGMCIVAKQTNNYTVTVTDNNGCKSETTPIRISVFPQPADTISSDKSIFCVNDSAMICNSGQFTSYQWNTGEKTKCIQAKEAGAYYVTVTDNNGCTAQSNRVPISIYPIPSVSIIVQGNHLSSFGAVTYQWYLNDTPILGATSDTLLAQQQGSYSLEVSDNNGCSTLSDPVNMVANGLDNLEEDQILLFPNPNSSGTWQLAVDNSLINNEVEVYDAQGQLVYHAVLKTTKSEIALNVASGIYWLRVSTTNGALVRKLIKF